MKTIEAQFYENFKNEQRGYQENYKRSIKELDNLYNNNKEQLSTPPVIFTVIMPVYYYCHNLVNFY